MWTSPRKSLVKGERFIRFEEIPEHTYKGENFEPTQNAVLRNAVRAATVF